MMSDLQVGDRVQTVSKDGSLIYSFLEKQQDTTTMYKSIATSGNTTIHLTGNHPVYTRKGGTDKFIPIYADKVSIGDDILVQENNGLTPAKVANVWSQVMKGAFAPLTMEGNIMVDGVLASCYPSTHHDAGHLGMAPMRWFPTFIEPIFGVDNDGRQGFAVIEEYMGKWIVPST